MKYLVTGATGFIGPYLIRKLASQGHECRCLIRKDSNTELLKDYDIEFVTGDITDAGTLTDIGEGVDCLIHMATLGHMSNYAVSESRFNAVNIEGTVNIMQSALNAEIKKIVHCSTVAAMGICRDFPATEESACFPHHPYGRSKLKAEEEVLRLVREKNLPAAIIRFSMVYGPGDRRDILKLTRLAKKGLFPKVGNRAKLTPLIHADDAVDGILLAAERGKPGEIYLITNRKSEPFDTIRRTITDALDSKKPDIYIPEWAALISAAFIEKAFLLIGKTPPVTRKNIESTLADRVFSVEKAVRELGFDPKTDPAEGLRNTVLWYKEKGWI
jgi:nucleoside-diphosphate-sugar epimerase